MTQPYRVGRLPEDVVLGRYWDQVGDLQNVGKDHTAPRLRQLQGRFMAYIRYPKGIDGAQRDFQQQDPESTRLTTWLKGRDEEHAAGRLAIYSSMYFDRLLETIKEYFPRVVASMDETSFHDMILDYLLVYPSRHPSIAHVGDRLETFLREFPRPGQPSWLPDLVALDWARIQRICAPNKAAIDQQSMAAHPPETWGELYFELTPTCTFLHVDYPIEKVWLALHEGEETPEIEPADREIIIWRKEFVVRHAAIDPTEARALQQLQQGESFNNFCGVFLEAVCPPDQEPTPEMIQTAVQQAYTCFGTWLQAGLFTEVMTTPPPHHGTQEATSEAS